MYCYDLHRYLNFYCKHPVLCEKLMKEGFAPIIKETFYKGFGKLNYRAKDTKTFFGVKNKNELRAIKNNQDLISPQEIARLKKFNVDITDKSLKWANDNIFYENAYDDLKELILKR